MTGWYTRITIGNDEFKTGDRRIIGLDVTLSENARASTCNFEVYDPGLKIGGRYFLESYESGGIQVPSDLLEAPKPPASTGTTAGAAVGTSGGVLTVDGVGSWLIDRSPHIPDNQKGAFWDGVQQIGSKLGIDPNYLAIIFVTETGVDGEIDPAAYNGNCGGLIQFCNGGGASEVGSTAEAISAMSALEQLPLIEQYLSSKNIPAGADLPTVYLAVLWPAAVDAGRTESLAQIPQQSEHLYGADGSLTKETLEAGLMKKARVAEFPGASTPPTPPPAPPAIVDTAKPEPATVTTDPTATTTTAPTATTGEATTTTPTAATPSSPKGTEIIVELGTNPSQLIGWHFIHTGTTVSGRSPDTTKFEGKCIRWEMSRRNVNATWENITLRQLAETVAEAFGRELLMEGDGPTYAVLDATGISLYELLLRECKAIGYRVFDEGNAIVLEPYRPQFSGFIVTRQILIGMPSSVDRATGDSYKSASPDPPNPATPTEQAAETVLEVDGLTGEIKQVAPENSTGTGALDTAILTGNATPPVHGVVLSPPQGASAVTAVATAAATEIIPDNPLPMYRGILPESVTGLPSQQIGAIDLADGKAQAEAIADESRRVMSYETQIDIRTTPASLTLVPGQIIAIAEDCFENRAARDAWCKEWRISQVQRSFRNGSISTSLSIYTPQAQKPPQQTATATTAGSAAPTTSGGMASGVNLKPGELIWPMRIEGNSSANGSGDNCTEFGYDRGRLHDGLDFGGYGIEPDPDLVWASGDGEVTNAAYEDGYGNIVKIQHPSGVMTFYAHLDQMFVSAGQQVKQGDKVGIRGATGGNYDIHLHFGTHVNGEPTDPREVIKDPGIPIVSP